MGWSTYQGTMSVRVRHERSYERSRVRLLNVRLEQLAEEFEDLNLMVFGFEEEDFNEVTVTAIEDGVVEDERGFALVEIKYDKGALFDKDYADKHGVKYDPTEIHEG